MTQDTAVQDLPPLKLDLANYAKLDDKQVGHLRHFYNLVSQKDGDWHYFSTAEGHNEFDDAARYQLATMAYAAGAAHYHRLPALRGPFKALMHQMIHKMLRREVWAYWYTTSQSGKYFDPDLKELRKPWADPVSKENIMYSGHLLLMTSLYAMLFDDDEYEQEGGITFRWNPLFWGFGPETFTYNNRQLSQVILKQMEENDYVGVCCEPNAVFVVCNQFPLVAMRYNDIRDGTDIVSKEILPKYKAALTKKGMFAADGLYAAFFALKQQRAISAVHGAHTAWANAFMNAWNSDFVHSMYEKQSLGFLVELDGKTRLQATCIAKAFRKLVDEEGYDPKDKATLDAAREQWQDHKSRVPFETLNWLAWTMMLSELGRQKELNDLFDQVDEFCNPTWINGGLYYPRNDVLFDSEYNLTHVEPHSGNSGIGYARLNVRNGQKIMWEQPWTRETLSARPWVDGVGYADDVDFLRGVWDPDHMAMIITLRRWCGNCKPVNLRIQNLEVGKWAIYVNGKPKDIYMVCANGGSVKIDLAVGQDETDIVLQRV